MSLSLPFHSLITPLSLLLILFSCQSKKQTTQESEPQLVGPTFCEDSAMVYCAEQCAFGPRTMNSEAHERCAEWIVSKFRQYGCEVSEQKASVKAWDGNTLHFTNIIARLNPEAKQRIMITAHWDSRPWADNDPDEANHHTPVMAANDGASGIAVMLELARTVNVNVPIPVNVGIDFVCFDAEDYGTPQWHSQQDESSWALGAQYFAKKIGSSPTGGGWIGAINLDMVGGQGAKFYQERFSKDYAQSIIDEVWQAANDAGYGSYFPYSAGGYITDDHKPLNEAGIPAIDIVPYYPDCEESAFGPTWHTVSDDMQHIDKNTLKAVGQTLIQYLYTR